MEGIRTRSPVDGQILVERPFASASELAGVLARARTAQVEWQALSIASRASYLERFVAAMMSEGEAIALELTLQMGRPIAQAPSELAGFEQRATHMTTIAEQSLSAVPVAEEPGSSRWIERLPHGVVLVVAPWNYPYLTAVNSVVPALMAGNVVVLKHSPQTPLCAERFGAAFEQAGLPEGVFQFVHCSNEGVASAVRSPDVDFVSFTGSVTGGRAVQAAASGRFIPIGLELGGKDPAYVRPDASIEHAASNLVDGAFYNSGQSCCGVERIYVHQERYSEFVDAFVALTEQYRLGDPRDRDTNLGPVVSAASSTFVQTQIDAALAAGARALVPTKKFPAHAPGTPYIAPQVLIDVDHRMSVMSEESFGPVVGIMPVRDDDQAVLLMNDSDFGLTASVWTQDEDRATSLGRRVQTGTWFMNRCDYLDPALAWTGTKNSGRGVSLSRLGYEALTRPKSMHLRRS